MIESSSARTSFESRWFSLGYLGSRSTLLRAIIPSKVKTSSKFLIWFCDSVIFHCYYRLSVIVEIRFSWIWMSHTNSTSHKFNFTQIKLSLIVCYANKPGQKQKEGPFCSLKGLTLSGRARGPGLSRQKREFEESGCSLLASDAGPRAHIENVTRGIFQ